MLKQISRDDQAISRVQQPRPEAVRTAINGFAPGNRSDAPSGSTAPATDDQASVAAQGVKDGLKIRDGVERLNGDGDSAYLRITPEAKAQADWRAAQIGLKGQLGADLRVTQNGEGADATYTLRYDKHSLGALTGEAGLDKLDRVGAKPGTLPDTPAGPKNDLTGKLKLEAGAQTFDAVEMTFATKEDAIRAAETIQRLHMADMMGDAVDMAISATGPMAAPLDAANGALSGGGDNPLGNPLNADGAPGSVSRDLAGVSDQDLAFLQDNITAYETTIGTRGRLAAEVKADLQKFNLAGEGRLDGTSRISRRVELPTDDKDGSVTYTMQGGLRASAKEKLQTGFDLNGIPVEPKLENRLELANATAGISLKYTIPQGTDVAQSNGGRPLPEAGSQSGTEGLVLDSVTLNTQLEYRTQGLDDLTRGDSRRETASVTIDNPDNLGDAAARFFDGDFAGAATAAGARVDLKSQTIERSGAATQTGVKLDLGVADLEGSVIFEAGVDDVTETRSREIAPGAPEPRTETRIPPAPQDDGQTLVVTPWQGANIRTQPGGDAAGVVQNGSFLRSDGQRQTGADGQDWLHVTGTDVNDAPVEGWVRADLVAEHSSATGAMDKTGRINPTLEHNRPDAITVRQDDNLWNIAREHGVDPQELIAMNSQHLQNPSLIFKGDTVYLPGTERGPKPETVELPATPQDSSDADAGSRPGNSTPQSPTEQGRAPGPNDANPGDSGAPDMDSTPEGTKPAPDFDSTPPGTEPAPGSNTNPTEPTPGATGMDSTPEGTQPAPDFDSTPPGTEPAPGSNANPTEPTPGATGMDSTPEGTDPAPDFDSTPPTAETAPGDTGAQPTERPDLGQILRDYQVHDDAMVDYTPKLGPLPIDVPFIGARRMTETEGELLDRLNPFQQLEFRDITSNDENDLGLAYRTANEHFPQYDGATYIPGGEDGHNDAFRHAYWNALMTDRFGEEFANSFATAHEGVPGNPAAKEAMDLYNNEVGRRIARENAGASDEELAGLVAQAVRDGEMLVIGSDGNLAWSDQVEIGQTGNANPGVLPGQQTPPDYNSN